MKNKLLIIAFALLSTFYANAQTKYTKEDICKNWMVLTVKSMQTGDKEGVRGEGAWTPPPMADFVIKSDGTFDIKFDNIGSGTWRLENDCILFWKEDPKRNQPKVELVARINDIQKDKMLLTLLATTKYYDWELKLVPFN